MTETETVYIVKCDDCGLFESYKNKRIARGHKNSHWEDHQHVAEVEEAECYPTGYETDWGNR